MKRYRLIAFDLDGTISNPQSGLLKSFSYALDKMGVDYGGKASLLRFIGPPLYDEWRAAYGFTPEEAERALTYFHEYYDTVGWADNELYEGISTVLSELKRRGKTVILATSKPVEFARKILDLFDITQYFDYVGGALDDRKADKKSEVLSLGLSMFPDIRKEDCVLVGDRMYDAEGAAICGIESIGVLYGYGTREELSSAGFAAFAQSVGDLPDLLL